jgi:UDP-N-acetylmuramoyl-tripeptide--D-alanyl-D-alanine ligase
MRAWSTERVARAAGARMVRGAAQDGGPARATVDSRTVRPGDLFAGLRGERADGGRFAGEALAAGAWGALVGPEHEALGRTGAVLVADDPLAALQRLATAWRHQLGAAGGRVIGVTGSTGKTSTKDILAAMLAPHRRTWASPANLNTEIGLPLAVLAAPEGTEALVLELAMRGAGQIAELTAIADPDVGVIVNVGPVHLELLGSLEAIAAAKAELLRDMRPGGTAIVPAGEPLLDDHRPAHLALVTFGEGGDVSLVEARGDRLRIDAAGVAVELEVSFAQPHQRTNALAAVAAARAVGVTPSGRVDVSFSAWRGERIDLPGDIVVINDCYNANPMSMRAALDDLAVSAAGRRVAVLGDMLELGADEAAFHHEAGRQAARAGVEVLVAVGGLAEAVAEGYEAGLSGGDRAPVRGRHDAHVVADAETATRLVRELVAPGDTVLVKASRGVGLERVAQSLAEHAVETS